jgi:hypothetical protein
MTGTLKSQITCPPNNINPSLRILSTITIPYFKVSKHTPQK